MMSNDLPSPDYGERVPFVTRDRRDGDWRHGTAAGATRHAADGELPCDACRAAKAAYDKRRLSAPEATVRNRLCARAQVAAYGALAKTHPEEYRRLYLAYKESMFQEAGLDL
jgi:hypothetical protein